MKFHPALQLALQLALTLPAACLATEASPASIEKLLDVTRAETLVDSMYANLEQAMRGGMQQALQGQTLSDEQRRVIELAPKRFAEVMRQEFSWATVKDIYVQIYRESFTEEEVQGLIAFYVSPAGQAYVNKMPQVMQRSMFVMQQRMQPLMAKMKEAMQKAVEDAKAAR